MDKHHITIIFDKTRNIEDKEKALVKREEQLRNKFAKMEEAMSQIQAQGSSVQSAVAGMGGK